MSNNNIQQTYEQVRKFNLISGSIASANLDSIKLQIDLLQEEVQEAVDAFAAKDAVETLDAACDIFVVASGLLQLLEALGCNVEKALARVCENNLSKMPEQDAEGLCPEGATVTTTPYGNVVYKRADNKVVKPTNFVPVNLVSCVPDNFFPIVEEVVLPEVTQTVKTYKITEETTSENTEI